MTTIEQVKAKVEEFAEGVKTFQSEHTAKSEQ